MDHTSESLLRSGNRRHVERKVRALLARSPDDPALLVLLGRIERDRGDLDQAIDRFERVVELAPGNVEYLELLSGARLSRGDLDGAERDALRARDIAPERARPVVLVGLVAMERGDSRTAIEWLLAAAAMEMPNLEAVTHLASALNRIGQWESAEEWSRYALGVEPDHTGSWINLGLALKSQQRFAEAREAFRRAGPDPRARFNLGYTLMLEGAIADGLPLLEARKPLLGIGRSLTKREWDGRPRPDQTLLVTHEQGFGDTLLMCRFWPALRERFAHVVAHVQPPLAKLLAGAFPGIEVVTALDGVHYDLWCATMSVPWLLGIDAVERIPLAPWLRLSEPAPARDDGAPLRIGINWAGNPKFAFDAIRSTHLSSLEILLRAPGVEWVSLHRGHLEHEAAAAGLPQPLREARDFLDTARVIQQLDMVVSTETAVPNLSAAMGVSTCVLTSPDWDWRWAHWYPGITLCPQDQPGEWMSVCVRVLEAIRARLLSRVSQAA